MLTRDDQTVTDCREVVKELAGLGVSHVGFKDVGVRPAVLEALHADIKALGATSYLEVVSTTAQEALDSARLAVSLGVNRLMGGTWVARTLEIVAGTPTEYFPFPGSPQGHPTVLRGSPQDIAADCARYGQMGCHGVDLLAYRAVGHDPLDLVTAARQATSGQLIVAGSVSTASQVQALARAGVDGFTIGSAAFSGDVDRRSALLRSQLSTVSAWIADAPLTHAGDRT